MSNPSSALSNKELVIQAMNAMLNDHDASAVERYFGDNYIQHGPGSPNGRDYLVGLIGGLAPEVRADIGLVVAEGDVVVVHSRLHGIGPKPLIAADFLRLENGKIVEHWGVEQEEVPTSETVSGNPMFSGA